MIIKKSHLLKLKARLGYSLYTPNDNIKTRL